MEMSSDAGDAAAIDRCSETETRRRLDPAARLAFRLVAEVVLLARSRRERRLRVSGRAREVAAASEARSPN